MFCNVLHDEKGKIGDLISDLLAWKSENLFTVLIPVFGNINNSEPLFPTSTFDFFLGVDSGPHQAVTHVLSCS